MSASASSCCDGIFWYLLYTLRMLSGGRSWGSSCGMVPADVGRLCNGRRQGVVGTSRPAVPAKHSCASVPGSRRGVPDWDKTVCVLTEAFAMGFGAPPLLTPRSPHHALLDRVY
jgi:hypothetical protein